MKLIATTDVPDSVRHHLVADLATVISVEDQGQVLARAAGPTSFIELVGEAIEWVTPLKDVAKAFLLQLVKEAATDLWKHKKQIAAVLGTAAMASLKKIVSALARARERCTRKPEITIGIGPSFALLKVALVRPPTNEAECAWVLAHFVLKAERAEAIIVEESQSKDGVLIPAQLEIRPDGKGLLRWLDHKGTRHEGTIE